MGGHRILLRDRLDGVADPDGQGATVKNRERGVLNVDPADRFNDGRDAQADQRAHRVLHQRDPQGIVVLGRSAEHHELYGDRSSAEQFQPIAITQSQMLAAQVVEAHRGAERAGHDAPSQSLPDDQRQDRDDDDVHRADESRIGHLGVSEPDLLRGDRDGNRHAQDDAGSPRPSVRRRRRIALADGRGRLQPVA